MSFDDWEMEIAKRLNEEVDRYAWVGIYWLRGQELHLGAWRGPAATEHTRIQVGEGICGMAVRRGKTVIVDNVDDYDEFIACFPETRSEIVVPIMQNGDPIGEIDIDGNKPALFGSEDREALEKLAREIARRAMPL